MKIVLSIFLFAFSIILSAQEVVEEKINGDTIVFDYQLTELKYTAWLKIKQNWTRKDFQEVIKENKIKMGCGGISNNECESLYVDVILKINEKGKLEYYKLLNGKKCGESITKPFEIRMMRNFFKIEFPEELRNLKLQTRLGSALKC